MIASFLFWIAVIVFFSVERPRWLFRWMGQLMVVYVLAFLAWDLLHGAGLGLIALDLVVLGFVLSAFEIGRRRAVRKATVAAYRRWWFGEK